MLKDGKLFEKFILILLDFSLSVKAATLILISGCGSAISSAKEGEFILGEHPFDFHWRGGGVPEDYFKFGPGQFFLFMRRLCGMALDYFYIQECV